MTTNTDHLAIRNIPEGHLFVCAHCGVAQIVCLPLPMPNWLRASRAFMKAPRLCQPQPPQPAADKRIPARLEF